MDYLWTTLPLIWSECARSLIIFLWTPLLIWILFVFLPMIHCIASRWSTFQGVSRSVDVILVKDFANSIDILFVWRSFHSGINSHTSKIMSIQSLVVEMKSERCQFLKIKFLRSKTQHTLFNVIFWLSCILKTEMTRCKIKMTFFMVLCISFNLWSWVYLLMVCDEVTFCEFKETKGSKSKLEDSSRKIVFFLAPILLACIITSSLIHEATTLMEKLFKFWERHLSVQIAYLIKKGFLKHVMQAMVHGLWKRGKFRLKRCLRVSKT